MADNPYRSIQRFPGDGVTVDWTVSFAGNRPDAGSGTTPYLSAADVIAYEIIPASALAAEVRIDRTITYVGPNQFRVSPAVASGRILVIRRKTEDRYPLVDFNSLQAVSEFDLDRSNRQLLFLTQEAVDQARLAEEVAGAAEQIAYSSVNDAALALTTANTANTKATNAVATAANAAADADDAVETANLADAKANSATATANTALSTANAATTTANGAVVTANAADTKANTAIATANGAVDTAVAAAADADEALANSEDALAAASAAQTAASNTEGLAATADANAAEALATANAIDGKAQEALDNSAYATQRADLAMTLVEDAGVGTFNGRAGEVTAQAGDYTAAQITFDSATTVEEAIQDLSEYDTVLQTDYMAKLAALDTQFTGQLNAVANSKLDSTATAVNSQQLAGQLPSYYATASALTSGLAGKLGLNAKADGAVWAERLLTPRTINGVSFNGTANIVVQDGTKLPLSGGTVTNDINFNPQGGSNWVGLGFDPARAYSLRIHSPNIAYTWIGARNSSWTHYESGTGSHYFYGQIQAQGNITAYSDIRLKANIEVIRNALDKVDLLGGYTYDRTDLNNDRQAGVIAQQVQAVLPEAVREDPECGTLAVSYNGVVALLVAAIQELRDEVRALKNDSTK